MIYYGYDRSRSYLSHKGKKGAKWGYTKGKKNGKRTAKGYKDDYKVGDYRRIGDKGYTLDKAANGRDTYTHKNSDGSTSKVTITKGKGLLDSKSSGVVRGSDGKKLAEYTTIKEGALTRGKRAAGKGVAKAAKKVSKATKKIGKTTKVKSKEVAKKAEKGKKKMLKYLEKKGIYNSKAKTSVTYVDASTSNKSKKKKSSSKTKSKKKKK